MATIKPIDLVTGLKVLLFVQAEGTYAGLIDLAGGVIRGESGLIRFIHH